MRKNDTHMEFDWFDVFPEPIKLHVTSWIRVWRHYKKGLLRIFDQDYETDYMWHVSVLPFSTFKNNNYITEPFKLKTYFS